MLDLKDALGKIGQLDPKSQKEILDLLNELEEVRSVTGARENFLPFVKYLWPTFVEGTHHKIISELFDDVISGRKKRIIINMPPRHTKSEFASVFLPAYFLGRYPEKKIIQTSHTAELAVNFGRRVRNIINGGIFQDVFPNVSLSSDSKAAGRWATNKGGEYYAIGVGGTVTGKGADLFVIDDPHSEQEAIIAESNPEIYNGVMEWYESGPRQRLQPGGSIILVMCMTGDTDVLMGDGSHRELRDIRPGDIVATYDDGNITTACVNNWKSSGVDSVFTITTRSGRTIRANERHPFLVEKYGKREWLRLRELHPGMSLVAVTDAPDRQDRNNVPDFAIHAKPRLRIIARTLMRHISRLAIMVTGKANPAIVGSQFTAKGFASPVTTGSTKDRKKHRNRDVIDVSKADTASPLNNTIQWLKNATIVAMSAASDRPQPIHAPIGMGSCASTIATIPELFGGFSATTATLLLGMERQQRFLKGRLNTFGVTLDEIVSITYSGEEEVFDVEIDRTENFIANGVVSHNTRWSQRDLTARLLKKQDEEPGTDKWEVVTLPAILPADPEKNKPDRPIWPEFWSLDELLTTKASIPVSKWNAQYQQEPTSEEGALIKREYWQDWDKAKPPECESIIQSWDTAMSKDTRANYSAVTTWGVFKDDEGKNNIILLDAVRGKWEFPILKKKAKEFYDLHKPDICLIEARAAGQPLIYEMRRMGLPVQDVKAGRGTGEMRNDKISRVNSITDIFHSGFVWAQKERLWAQEVIEECAAFPAGEYDDYVDTVTMALQRFRQGGWVGTKLDEEDDKEEPSRKLEYY